MRLIAQRLETLKQKQKSETTLGQLLVSTQPQLLMIRVTDVAFSCWINHTLFYASHLKVTLINQQGIPFPW